MSGHSPRLPKLAPNPPKKLPHFNVVLKTKSGEEVGFVDPRATRALVACMDMAAVIGGAASHWGGPAAFAEINSVIYGLAFHRAFKENKEWFELFNLVNDAGHCENGVFALKANYGYADMNLDTLMGFRSIDSKLTGHGEVHVFPDGVLLSNGPLGSSFGQAQGLSMADRMAERNRVTVVTISDGASMEGEAKEVFASIPGWAKKGKLAPFVCVLSDNNTKLSGRIDEDAFSMGPYFDSLESQGWKVFDLKNPHEMNETLNVYEEALAWAESHPEHPALIRAHTIKGYGTKKTMESSSGGHGFPLKKPEELVEFVGEIFAPDDVPSEITELIDQQIDRVNSKRKEPSSSIVPDEKVQVGISQAMINRKESGLPIISISADLPGSTGTASFQKKFPGCSFDMGVAESNMVSVGAGFSKASYIPVVDTFSQFGTTKGALPLIMSSLSLSPMIAVFSHIGFQDAADGASHQALTYYSMVSSIPLVDVYCLTSSEEAFHLMGQAIDQFALSMKDGKVPRTSVFFLGRENFPQTYFEKTPEYELGSSMVVRDTSSDFDKSVTIVAAGPLLPQGLLAVESLKEQSIGTVLINPSIINRPDMETLNKALDKTNGRLITVEDHQIIGGMGSLITHELCKQGRTVKYKALGVDGGFGQSAYMALELYQLHKLDSHSIVESAKSFF